LTDLAFSTDEGTIEVFFNTGTDTPFDVPLFL